MSRRAGRRQRARAKTLNNGARAAIIAPTPTATVDGAIKQIANTLAMRRVAAHSRNQAKHNPFNIKPSEIMPPVMNDNGPASEIGLAMDEAFGDITSWAAEGYGSPLGAESFIGFSTLAIMATIAEYRRAVETIARHMTRQWITLKTVGEGDKAEKIALIEAEMKRLKVQKSFRKIAEHDGYFGRAHLFLEFGGEYDDGVELATSAGDGSNDVSASKCNRKTPLTAVRPIEAVWVYPNAYDAHNPLSPTFYKPQTWSIQGKQVHCTRLLTFIGREVSDLVKPTYAFGGLSLTQMGRPSVENWLETRKSINDIVSAFSVMVLKMNLQQVLEGAGEALLARTEMFNAQRDNRGLLTIGVDEEFQNVSAPLGGLDALQSQAQEHMASVWGIPVEAFTGNQPMGLNASSEGQMRVFYDWINACQEDLFRDPLEAVVGFIQLSLFGEVDPNIVVDFNDLEGVNEGDKLDNEAKKAAIHQVYIEEGVVTADEARNNLMTDSDSIYSGLAGNAPGGGNENEPPSPWEALAGVRGAADK